MRTAAFSACACATNPMVFVKRLHPWAKCSVKNNPNATLTEERSVFVEAFKNAYKQVPRETLKLPQSKTLEMFLEEAFSEEVVAFQAVSCQDLSNQMDTNVRFYSACIQNENEKSEAGNIAGYLSIDVSPSQQEVYMRQLAVAPKYQRRGIANALIKYAMNDVKDVQKVTVSYRKSNHPAARLYKSLGFVDDLSCHSSLDPEIYAGLRWDRSTETNVEID